MYSLERDFNSMFCMESGCSDKLSSDNMRLRYQVWCLENNYFSQDQFDSPKESDEYDNRSVYVVLSSKDRRINIATARVILSNKNNESDKFPVENFVMLRRNDRDLFRTVSRSRIGEISRFCVSKVYRRRALESTTIHGITPVGLDNNSIGKRSYSYITLGLFKGLIEVSLAENLEYWYALMEPSLLRLLKNYGVCFSYIGPRVNYFGIRQPCMVSIENVLHGIRNNSEEIANFVCPRPIIPFMATADAGYSPNHQ